MIKVLIKELDHYYKYTAVDDSESIAPEILTALEKAGMIPPVYKKYNYSKEEAYNTLDYKFGMDNPQGFYIEKDEWEPENEES